MAEDGEEGGLTEEKIAEDAIHFMEVDLPPLNRARFYMLCTYLCNKINTTIEDGLEEIGDSEDDEESAKVLECRCSEPLGEILRAPEVIALSEKICKRLWIKLSDLADMVELQRGGLVPIENLVPLGKKISRLGERMSRMKKLHLTVASILLEMKAADGERPRKRQKREEEEGESSAMGAFRVSTSTKDEDALKVLAFEQRIRELESERDASKSAFEKEKAAHKATMNATMRLLRGHHLAATGIPRQATTDEPEAIPLQDTTDEPEHLS